MVFGRCASRESIPAFQSDGRREVVSIGILLVRKLLLYFDGNLTPNFLSRGPFLGGVDEPPIHKAMVYNDAAMRKKKMLTPKWPWPATMALVLALVIAYSTSMGCLTQLM